MMFEVASSLALFQCLEAKNLKDQSPYLVVLTDGTSAKF